MIMVGLSLLGLGFVALSETETAISVNERNYAQVASVAEAGGNMVVNWFQNPVWSQSSGLMPTNVGIDAIKVTRILTGTNPYTGKYKPVAGSRLCDKPFKQGAENRFYGTEQDPDLLINDKTLPDFLARFNIALFNTDGTAVPASNCGGCDNIDGGRVTEIRIYAPPIDGGVLNTQVGWNNSATSGIPNTTGFWEGGARFGLATIKVTASKFADPNCGPYKAGCQAIATRSVKYTVSEYPIPGPGGPLETQSDLGTNGDFQVHWGRVDAQGNVTIKRHFVGIPWHDAYERANFERGYDYQQYPVPQPAGVYTSNYKDTIPWLYELIGRSFEDPWYDARARGLVTNLATAADPHEARYAPNTAFATAALVAARDPSSPTCSPCGAGKVNAATYTPGGSNFFQLQDHSSGCATFNQCDYKEVVFPNIKYRFWKQIAVAGQNQPNIYYLRWAGGTNFVDKTGTCTQDASAWVDTSSTPALPCGKPQPGFYFFDTQNGQDPQNGGPGLLTPGVSLGSVHMEGFIYMNATDLKAGNGGTSEYVNMPGEPYRDVGFWAVDDDPASLQFKDWKRAAPLVACVPTTGVGCVMYSPNGSPARKNGKWDYQDLSFGARAGQFDYVVASKNPAVAPSAGGSARNSTPAIAAADSFFIVPYDPTVPACIAAGGPGTVCSEPHEPYLNIVYPAAAGSPSIPKWSSPNVFRPKKKDAAGAPVVCSGTASEGTGGDCTSNGYDLDGPLVQLTLLLDGVLYNEGTFTSTSNGQYFGSILLGGAVNVKGTPDVWFDEKLIKEEWPPSSFGFPRVFISSVQTDQ